MEDRMNDPAKILAFINQQALCADGSLDPKKVSNRLIRQSLKANSNLVCAILKDWRANFQGEGLRSATKTRKPSAVPKVKIDLGQSQAEPRPPIPPAAPSEPLNTSGLQQIASEPRDAMKRPDNSEALNDLILENLALRREVEDLKAGSALKSATPAVNQVPKWKDRAPGLSEARDKEPRPPGQELFDRASREAARILEETGRPLTAIQIFKMLPAEMTENIGDRRAQELIRLAAHCDKGIEQLPDGRWCRGKLVFVSRPRAKPERFFEIRKKFSDFSFELIKLEGRPFATTELFDRFAKQENTGFVRGYASGVLDTAGHPGLVKLADSSWWLAGAEVPEGSSRVGGHSRRRNECYPELANHVTLALTVAGRPMSGRELLRTIPPSLREKLPTYSIHHALKLAQRENPNLYRREDKNWWLKGLEPTTVAPPSQRQRLLSATIEILGSGGPMSARAIRRLLPDDLQAAFPTIKRPLEELRSRIPGLELNGKLWSLNEKVR
jgi:hypothetical protein